MPQNRSPLLDDSLIRAAVRRALDSVEAPPVEESWQRFQSRRTAASARRPRPWSRYAALAAALLLVFCGGYGAYRALISGNFNHALLMDQESESAEILAAEPAGEREVSDSAAPWPDFAGWSPLQPSREAAQQLPQALDGYTLDTAYTREAQSGITYLAALYKGKEQEPLLWVQAGTASPDQFFADLEQLLQLPVEETAADGEAPSTRLAVGSRPAFSWEKDGRRHLFIDLSGHSSPTELQRLAPR
ncbi:MAG TPA: hypothetical protein PLY40_09155 [Bacillota bacterium]|nr:hypothetical protein [Bacillota bacterium]